jgi:inosine triphosphate pyrophosphatase
MFEILLLATMVASCAVFSFLIPPGPGHLSVRGSVPGLGRCGAHWSRENRRSSALCVRKRPKSFGKAVADGDSFEEEDDDDNVSEIEVQYGPQGVIPTHVTSKEEVGEFAKYDLLKPIAQAPMTKKKLTFISSNALKIAEVKSILLDDSDGCHFPYELVCTGAELLEPQATPIEISRAKCIQALRLVDGPVCVEDTSLHFNALQGMPGPYIKSFFESMGNEGLSNLLAGFEDRSAYAQCVVSFSHGLNSEIHTFCGISEGIIVDPEELRAREKKGTSFGWDPLFIPDKGEGKTFGELDRKQKNRLSHRFKAFRQLKSFINDRGDRWVIS